MDEVGLNSLQQPYNDLEHEEWHERRSDLLDYAPSSTALDSVHGNDKDYFGIGNPFDLAMLLADIQNAWKGRASKGLDGEKVRT